MSRKISRNLILAVMLFSVILTLNSCGSVELTSGWKNSDIKIDGNRNDWKDNIKFIKDVGAGIGILNDDHNLYLCLTLNDQSKMFPILRGGFTVWFYSPNNDKKTIGIEYPVAHKAGDMPKPQFRENGESRSFNPGNMFKRFLENQKEFEIVNKDKFPLTEYWIGSDSTVQVKMGFHDYQLVYEIKIPLADSASQNLYYADAKPGQTIKIGFETGELQRKRPDARGEGFGMREGGESGEGGEGRGGMYPGGEGRRPGMGRGQRRRNEDSFKPVNFEAEVKLAASDSAASRTK